MKTSTYALSVASILCFALPFACSDAPELNGKPPGPPGGEGGFEPGNGSMAIASSSAAGMSTASGETTGGGGGGGAGPPMCDDELKRCMHVFTYADKGESSVELRGDFAAGAWDVGVPMVKNGGTWEATAEIPYDKDVQYKFVLNGNNWINDPANPATIDDGFGGKNSLLTGETCEDYTCAPPTMGTFDWRDSILYFVFVDRFFDGNKNNNSAVGGSVQKPADYQGGDWAGVLQKINAGYFTDLGVNTLWLTVPMDNTSSSGLGTDGKNYSAYHGYWPANLDKPEERFGTMADLKAVVDAAHMKGIKVILDYAMNHVHKDSPVYQQHNDWFWPNDFNGKSCVCGFNDCQWDSPQARRCWFTDYLPDFNFTNAAARKFSVDNAIWWIQQTNIDGFRLDAVKHIEDQWLLDLRARVKAEIEPATGEHFYMVGETYTGDKGLIKYYVNPSTMLDGQFDFPLRADLVRTVLARKGSLQDLDGGLASSETYYGSGIMSTFIGNHDVPRSIHFADDAPWLGGNEWSDGKSNAWNNTPQIPASKAPFERFANAYTILLTTKGVPLIYYGDEIGLPGAGDPDNRRFMQWSGYSANQTFLLDHVKKLTKIRADHPALRRGKRSTLSVNNDTMAYKMEQGADVVYVVVNRSDSQQSVGGLPGGALKNLLDDKTVNGPSLNLPARSSMVLVSP